MPDPDYDQQASAAAATAAPHSPKLQLGGPSVGRHDYFARADHRAWTLYLFLVTVADAQGLSYYSDPAIGRHLNLDAVALSAARQQLVQADLIAYQKPLYQVLALPPEADASVPDSPRAGQVQSVAEVLRRVVEGGRL